MNNRNSGIISEIEVTAKLLGLKPASVCTLSGTSGSFYKRAIDGQRFWPETVEKLRENMQQLIKNRTK